MRWRISKDNDLSSIQIGYAWNSSDQTPYLKIVRIRTDVSEFISSRASLRGSLTRKTRKITTLRFAFQPMVGFWSLSHSTFHLAGTPQNGRGRQWVIDKESHSLEDLTTMSQCVTSSLDQSNKKATISSTRFQDFFVVEMNDTALRRRPNPLDTWTRSSSCTHVILSSSWMADTSSRVSTVGQY